MKETGNTAQCFINMWWRISSICFSLFYFRDQSCVLSKNKRKISYFVKCIDFLIDGVTPMRGQHKPTIIHDSTTEKIFSNTQNVMVTCLTPSSGDLHWEISEESNSFQDPWSTESQPGCFWKRKKTVYILFSCSADSRKRKNYTAIWSYFFFVTQNSVLSSSILTNEKYTYTESIAQDPVKKGPELTAHFHILGFLYILRAERAQGR